ncbi:hypothetical protein V6N13_144460 [Hibiscus sabdariffa]
MNLRRGNIYCTTDPTTALKYELSKHMLMLGRMSMFVLETDKRMCSIIGKGDKPSMFPCPPDSVKALQHELVCKDALQKAKNLAKKKKQINIAHTCMTNSNDDDKPCTRNRMLNAISQCNLLAISDELSLIITAYYKHLVLSCF